MRTWWLIPLGCVLAGAGWRNDGSSVFTDARPPGGAATPAWTAPAAAKGSSSPVVVADKVFVTSEPTTLTAIDLATGAVLWSRTHPVVDALDPALRDAIAVYVDGLKDADARLKDLQVRYSEAMKAARAGRADVTGDLGRLSLEIAQLKRDLEVARPYLTPETGDMVGYASATPASDGRTIFATFSNGVVAAYELSGRLRWRVWLGPDDHQRRGYLGTSAASPVIVDGKLIVPYVNLTALSLTDGRVVWRGDAWPHYGTPAVAVVAGRSVLLSPDGRAIDPASGKTLRGGLGDLVYIGPTARGDEVWYVGNNVGTNTAKPNRATAWQLSWRDGALTATQRWSTEFVPTDRIYATPLVYGDKMFVITVHQELVVLALDSGAIVHQRKLGAPLDQAWAAPTAAGGRVFVASISGRLAELEATAPFATLRELQLDAGYAAPWFVGGALVWRGDRTVARYGAP
jgi:outer membrane protein assembly factor BamB